MEGTTVVIIPPSGSMKDYMDSLQKLMDYNFKYIGPGHGVVINKPKQEIERVYRHRVKREKNLKNCYRNQTFFVRRTYQKSLWRR